MNSSALQFIRFCVVGVSNGVVDFVVYFVITRFLFTFPEFILPAKAISYLVATLWSYFANRTFTYTRYSWWNRKVLQHRRTRDCIKCRRAARRGEYASVA